MDNKKLNEQESLELITQMIQNTKFKMVKKRRNSFFSMGLHDCGDFFAGLVSPEGNRQLLLAVFMASDAGCFLPGHYL